MMISFIYTYFLGHKTSNWTDAQIRQNLWDRKGLTLIQAQIRCPCNGGISLRDEEAWIRRENDIQKADKKRKAKKKKDLPSIITRVRCESENAPPQYDSHTAESDDVTDLEIASQFLRCRLEKGFSDKSKKSSKKTATPFKLEKSPEIEFPSIGKPRRPSSLSFCESDGMKVQSPTYNKVVSNGMGSNKNVKPVRRCGTSGFSEMNNASTDFTIGKNDFRRAPGAEKELGTPVREASGTLSREGLGTPIRDTLNLLSAAGETALMGFATLSGILGIPLTLPNVFSTPSSYVESPNFESLESMPSRSTPASTSSSNSDFIHPFLDAADPRQYHTDNDEESKKLQDYNIFKDYQFFK
uniref:Uncharacterized protein n=1 Tax=Panagrolaimus davidi TaxID=227884 RepID=A0A914Q2K3_9BILA